MFKDALNHNRIYHESKNILHILYKVPKLLGDDKSTIHTLLDYISIVKYPGTIFNEKEK